ncbi:HD-GYP domain-containing protein [Butyrivibrio sp. FCS014]|uniref:HD-GYP domain-containing protein n=1 Tax=Butyrivibrio sp. FCS014 TaxID=1408304 RepID=UPI000466A61A|nr:HD-GYP domain-containing protein [Butyrivibrio sp. FCS014]
MIRRNELVRLGIEQVICVIAILLLVFLSVDAGKDKADTDNAALMDINEGWIDEAGQAVDLYDLAPGRHSVVLDISKLSTKGKAICFKSIDTTFKVYASDGMICDYNPVIPRLLGISYGMQYHTVPIPEGSSFLRLYLEPVFADTPAGIRDLVISDAGQYMTSVFKRNLFSFGQSTITIVIGILFVIAGVTGQIVMKSTGIDFISFGISCVMVGYIGFNDTLLLQILTGRPDIIRVTEYMCLAFISFPALSFFSSITGESHSKLLSGMFAVCLFNYILQVGLTYDRLSDYYYLVYISQALILVCFAMAIVLVVRAVRRRTIKPALLRSVAWGLVSCISGAVIDVVRFNFLQSFGSLTFTRIGVQLFTAFMGIYLYRDHIDSLKKKQQESAVFASEISEAFAKVIDMKDTYTYGHSKRVAQYTGMIAKEMGYDAETVEKYYRIGLLHDVGKIGIPKAVLNKPGKLTDEEYDEIKTHTLKGHEVLKDISAVPELAVGALSHHERHDGKGYPYGLAGDDIPPVGRIIAVADAFDAMYSDRQYRKRMEFDKVISIIKEVSGTQLNPEVVEAFLRLVAKGEIKAIDVKETEQNDNIMEE